MKKLKMDLDALRVESFATEHDAESTDGTIWGHQERLPEPKPKTVGPGCLTQASCYITCRGGDCSFESCPGTCPYQGTCHRTCGFTCIEQNPRTMLIGVC